MKRFDFKRFGVVQDGVAMPLTTDSVLVGAWADMDADRGTILDVGTGCGVIALMVAQRSEENGSQIDAIDIDPQSCAVARLNAIASPWAERVSINNISLQQLTEERHRIYGHIISNPPFFSDSLKTPDSRRTAARHTETLTFDDLTRCSAELLVEGGLLTVIIPADRLKTFRLSTASNGFSLRRMAEVFTKEGTEAKRVMMEYEYSNEPTEPINEKIFIRLDNKWSREYMSLTKEFYIDF